MTAALLKTKLHIPSAQPELVPRPQLVDRLDAGLYRKLTLISAPAGFGKTTLANAWLRRTNEPVAWLSLDEGDNDLVRFLNYLVAAFRQVDDEIGQTAQRLLEAPQSPTVEVLLTELINDIVTQTLPCILVLDDYHAITDPEVHKAVSFLLEGQPPQIHLVIISRQDPPIPLSRLRGRGQVTEIRQSDLRFSIREATAFLNQAMGLNLETSEVTALKARTEGWIAGLQMAAVALQSRIAGSGTDSVPQFINSFSGRHHFILDYLTDEVLAHQPEAVHRFLLQTSILERMCGSLCDALIDPAKEASTFTSSREILETLQRKNLFVVPLDDEGQWVRYHRLFAELLRARLQKTAPDQVAELHRRAAVWHDENALLAEAVHYALEIPDFDLAAGMIERAIPKVSTWSSINVVMFKEWLKALPDGVVRARPRLRLFASRVFYVGGQKETAEQMLQELEESLVDTPSIPDTEDLLRAAMADRASYAAVRGDVKQTIELAHRTLKDLPEDKPMLRMRVSVILGLAHFRAGDVSEASESFSRAITAAQKANLGFVATPLICNLAEVQIVQGQLRLAYQTCEQAMEMAIVDGAPTSVAGFPGLELGKILYEQNDLPAAERYASEALALLGRSGTTDSFGIGHALLARIRQAQVDDDGAQAAIQRAIQIAQGFEIARISTLIGAYQTRIWLAQGKLEPATRWAQDYEQLGAAEYLREFEDLTLVRVHLAQDKPSEALALLDALLPPAEAAGRMGTVVETSILYALALQALGDVSGALATLERVLQLAEPEGYARVFIDEGQPMAHLLHKAADLGIAPNYVGQLLVALKHGTEVKQAIGMSSLVEPLSERELEVLALIADGLSNPEIGQRLFISLSTVKSHARNIYGKLGVHKRKDAVARARTLGILSP